MLKAKVSFPEAVSDAKAPLKWKKYLKLVEFGFVTSSELQSDIKRYPRSGASALMQDIERDLQDSTRMNRRNLYVVKLVSADIQGQLPNFRIETLLELKQLPTFLKASDSGPYTEVWYCRTRIDSGVFSVAGRFLFTRTDTPRTQLVEQVWRSSPRLLENYSSDLPYPYIRASRYGWAWPYSIERIHMPEGWGSSSDLLLEEFSNSLRIVEEEREKIEIFLSFLDSFSFDAFSLEYKIVGSKLTIIDWDTPNDRKVLT